MVKDLELPGSRLLVDFGTDRRQGQVGWGSLKKDRHTDQHAPGWPELRLRCPDDLNCCLNSTQVLMQQACTQFKLRS